MPRPFLLAMALLGPGAGNLAAEQPPSDHATWRWAVSSILASQRADDQAPESLGATDFHQHFERYAPNGLPEATVAIGR